MNTHKVKITVLKRMAPKDIFDKPPVTPAEPLEVCDIFEDGQIFISEPYGRMPEGFPCGSAWNTIYGTVRALAFGGVIPWYKEGDVSINCCTDGLRPVVFKIERI